MSLKPNNHCTDEQIIDYVLGHLEQESKLEVQGHLRVCNECQKKLDEWDYLMNDSEKVQPSSFVKQRLDKEITMFPKPSKSPNTKKVFALISNIAVLFLCMSLYWNMRTQDLTYEVAQNDDVKPDIVVRQPETSRLDIVPLTNFNDMEGNVWINDATNEVLVEVNGLTQLSANDYQLWVIHSNNQFNTEVLELQDGSVRVYYKSPNVAQLKVIKASIEPVGGSRVPIGPETFYVNVNQD
ncbi:hypothetical protein [Aquibacillus albus]|uniref:Anti-sigma factor RsiW n=1 Tax=Aquibacillus albus TaxID=1168171 RepID=A0ABS2N2P7_9BACI|nr:hypothetical protein [Aquibacillus albus]MBM7572405.1 anti-sigma factor RsiW [Aquibacillus albus]